MFVDASFHWTAERDDRRPAALRADPDAATWAWGPLTAKPPVAVLVTDQVKALADDHDRQDEHGPEAPRPAAPPGQPSPPGKDLTDASPEGGVSGGGSFTRMRFRRAFYVSTAFPPSSILCRGRN